MRLLYDLMETGATPFYVMLCGASVPCIMAVLLCLRTHAFEANAEIYATGFVIAVTVLKHAYDYDRQQHALLFSGYYPVLIVSGVRVRFTLICAIMAVHVVLIIVRLLILPSMNTVSAMSGVDVNRPEYFVLMLGITCLSTLYAYQLEKQMRKDFFVRDCIDRSKLQAVEILKGMFPEEAVNHVLSKVLKNDSRRDLNLKMRRLQEDRGIVSIIFCDISEFESLIEALRPVELVQLLDLVWMRFDRICDRTGVVLDCNYTRLD